MMKVSIKEWIFLLIIATIVGVTIPLITNNMSSNNKDIIVPNKKSENEILSESIDRLAKAIDKLEKKINGDAYEKTTR